MSDANAKVTDIAVLPTEAPTEQGTWRTLDAREAIAEIVWNSMIDRDDPPSLDDARAAADAILALDYLDTEGAQDLLHDGSTDDPGNKDWPSARVTPAPAWQPIESAPKDGTAILLGSPGWAHEGQWSEAIEGDEYEPGCLAGWTVPALNSYNDHGLKPTHWMPLPTPPCVSPLDQQDRTTGSTTQTVAPGPGSPPNLLPTPPCVEKG